MKLSKDYLNEVKVRLQDFTTARVQGKSRLLLSFESLFGHIEALEQELSEGFHIMAINTRLYFEKGTEEKGFVIEVKERNKDQWIVVGGKYEDQIIHKSLCDDVSVQEHLTELKQSNLMHQENEKALMVHRSELNEKVVKLERQINSIDEYAKKKAEQNRILRHDSDLLYGDYNKLKTENGLLLASLEQAMLDHQPVVLPKETVQTIEYYRRNGISNAEIIIIKAETKANETGLNRKNLQKVDFETLLKALVNGYTVEQSPEEANEAAFRAGMMAIYAEMDNVPFVDTNIRREEFAGRLIPLIKEIYQH